MPRPKGLKQPYWRSPLFALFMVFALMGGAYLGSGFLWQWVMAQDPEMLEGEVLSFRQSSRSAGTSTALREVTFRVKLSDGQIRRVSSGLAAISNCKVGSRVILLERKGMLSLAPEACPASSDTGTEANSKMRSLR